MTIDSKSIKIFLPEHIYKISNMNNLLISKKFELMDDVFNCEYFILLLINNPEKVNLEENKRILNRLCKKIDVQKRIVKLYSQDLSKIINNKKIDQNILILLMILYLHQAQKDKNVKFLNTTLKILDINFSFPGFLYIWADNLIEELV